LSGKAPRVDSRLNPERALLNSFFIDKRFYNFVELFSKINYRLRPEKSTTSVLNYSSFEFFDRKFNHSSYSKKYVQIYTNLSYT
jgi:hypothetical protein